jgi:hypothetical protein
MHAPGAPGMRGRSLRLISGPSSEFAFWRGQSLVDPRPKTTIRPGSASRGNDVSEGPLLKNFALRQPTKFQAPLFRTKRSPFSVSFRAHNESRTNPRKICTCTKACTNSFKICTSKMGDLKLFRMSTCGKMVVRVLIGSTRNFTECFRIKLLSQGGAQPAWNHTLVEKPGAGVALKFNLKNSGAKGVC